MNSFPEGGAFLADSNDAVSAGIQPCHTEQLVFIYGPVWIFLLRLAFSWIISFGWVLICRGLTFFGQCCVLAGLLSWRGSSGSR